MYGKMCAFLGKFWSKLTGCALLGLAFVASLSGTASAAETITIEAPDIDWTSIPAQIMSALTTPVIVGIGIALSVWVIFAGIKFFRRASN